jgi:hypothetical protein
MPTYVNNEQQFEVNDDEVDHLKIPPLPVPLYKESEDDPKKYTGDKSKILDRVAHKLYNVWLFWLAVRCNDKLDAILQRETEDKESDEFVLKATIVQMIDRLAKILVDTNLLEEIGELTGKVKST